MLCVLASRRSQELHLRPESHPYLPELGKPEMEFVESKRPRLELLPDPLLRPSPLLAAGQPGGSEDLTKVRPGPSQGLLGGWVLLRLHRVRGRGWAWWACPAGTQLGAGAGTQVGSAGHFLAGGGPLLPECAQPAGPPCPRAPETSFTLPPCKTGRAEMRGPAGTVEHPRCAASGGVSGISVNPRTVEAGSFFGLHFAQRRLTDGLTEGSQPVARAVHEGHPSVPKAVVLLSLPGMGRGPWPGGVLVLGWLSDGRPSVSVGLPHSHGDTR